MAAVEEKIERRVVAAPAFTVKNYQQPHQGSIASYEVILEVDFSCGLLSGKFFLFLHSLDPNQPSVTGQ
jgi:hypothetical protein